MTFDMGTFIFGVIGGAVAELLKWYQLRESPNLPAYSRSVFYWFITAAMIVMGGVLSVVQGIDSTKPLLALNVGLSAPLILKGLAMSVPEQPQPKTPGRLPQPSMIDFVAGR